MLKKQCLPSQINQNLFVCNQCHFLLARMPTMTIVATAISFDAKLVHLEMLNLVSSMAFLPSLCSLRSLRQKNAPFRLQSGIMSINLSSDITFVLLESFATTCVDRDELELHRFH